MAYRIDRIIPGGFHDYLLHLWEGSDLPVFMGSTQRAYLFDDKATADRVAQRLAEKCSETIALPGISGPLTITYQVVEVSKHAWGRYMVFSHDKYQTNYPDVVPAGRYDRLGDAEKHANSVTYKMVVVDSKAESRGFIYCNWHYSQPLTPDNCGASQLACNVINNTFLALDGFEAMRKQMAGTDYTAEHFGAELARIVDRETSEMLAALTVAEKYIGALPKPNVRKYFSELNHLEQTLKLIRLTIAKATGDNAGCDNCGTHDRVEGSKLCSYCGGSCPSDEDNACDGYIGDIDGLDVLA